MLGTPGRAPRESGGNGVRVGRRDTPSRQKLRLITYKSDKILLS